MRNSARALVTGGLGFVGSHIVDALVEHAIEITVLDDFSNGNASNIVDARRKTDVKVVRGSVTDPSAVKSAVEGVDLVFHEAAIVSIQQSFLQPELTTRVNVDGTRLLLNACKSAGVKKFVLASSAAVYGDSKVLPRTESSTPQPLSPYGRSKLEGERLLRSASNR